MSDPRFVASNDQLLALLQTCTHACQCQLKRCAGWESVSVTDWPKETLQHIATLRDPELHEPTFEEHHPHQTRYESADAPVSVKHFPYNRCDVFACQSCQQTVLRYTEYGGYYIDPRARRIHADLVSSEGADLHGAVIKGGGAS